MSHIHGETVDDVMLETTMRMEKTEDDLRREMASIRTGRASLALLDPIRADYYGTPTPLNQMATLSVPEPQLIVVQPWDSSQIGAIERAILASDLGLNPANDGKLIRLAIPSLTEERRKDLVRRLHHIVEDHRVAARNIRREANEAVKKLEKDKVISEDEMRRATDEVQKLTDGAIEKLDKAGKAKEHEILEIG
jgi:ribosome recycling factor